MLRIGMIGAGDIAAIHVANLARLPGVTLSGVCDVVRPKAEAFAGAHGGRAYADTQSLMADSDAVYICTPPQYHRDAVISAAQAGVDVFCEKPLSVTVDDAAAMEAAVIKSGVTCMVGFSMRFSPSFPHIKSMADNGAFGRILSFWGIRVLWLPHLPPNWRTDPRFICGMTIESLSHDFDFLHWVAGDVHTATGVVATSRPDLQGYDNIMGATLTLKSGGMANFHSSWASQVPFSQYGIVGTQGSAVFDWETVRIKTEADNCERRLEFKGPEDRVPSHQRETEHFIECLKTRQPPTSGIHDGVATVLISNAVLKSAELKRAVSLSELQTSRSHDGR